jgi:hypothetical protein
MPKAIKQIITARMILTNRPPRGAVHARTIATTAITSVNRSSKPTHRVVAMLSSWKRSRESHFQFWLSVRGAAMTENN